MVPIYTLHLPAFRFDNRIEFLDIRQRMIIEPVLRQKSLFLQHGCDATLFHKDSNDPGFGTPLIHVIDKDKLFTLRAYGKEAVKTLQFWKEWTFHTNPAWLTSALICHEEFVLEESLKKMVYRSDNYIPFNKCATIGDYFTDAEKPTAAFKDVFQCRLIGNLRTFLKNIGADDNGMRTRFELLEYPAVGYEYPALKRKGKEIFKKAFKIQIETNILLPLFFSLGQNTAYGCGLFNRVL